MDISSTMRISGPTPKLMLTDTVGNMWKRPNASAQVTAGPTPIVWTKRRLSEVLPIRVVKQNNLTTTTS